MSIPVKSQFSLHSSWLIRGRAGEDQAKMQPRPKDPRFAEEKKEIHVNKHFNFYNLLNVKIQADFIIYGLDYSRTRKQGKRVKNAI